jgi:hypothetical protein
MNGGSNIAWSPDGRSLVFCDKNASDAPPGMFMVDVESHAIKTLIEGEATSRSVFRRTEPDWPTRGPGFISRPCVMNWKTGANTNDAGTAIVAGIAWTTDSRSHEFSSIGWACSAYGRSARPAASRSGCR